MKQGSSDSGTKVTNPMGSSITTTRIALALLIVICTAGTALGQGPAVVSTRIGAEPPNGGLNVQVIVDGQIYMTPVTLLWPAGSRHTLQANDQAQDATGNVQYKVGGFVTNKGPCTSTAGAGPTPIAPALPTAACIFTADP